MVSNATISQRMITIFTKTARRYCTHFPAAIAQIGDARDGMASHVLDPSTALLSRIRTTVIYHQMTMGNLRGFHINRTRTRYLCGVVISATSSREGPDKSASVRNIQTDTTTTTTAITAVTPFATIRLNAACT